MGSSRNDDAPLAKVVDLRRWREERDRRLHGAAEEPELASTRAPDRIAWPFRVLALIAGLGFAACGGFLGSLPVRFLAGEGPWHIRLALLLIIFPLGVGMALFGIDLIGRGFVGRDWTTELWERPTGEPLRGGGRAGGRPGARRGGVFRRLRPRQLHLRGGGAAGQSPPSAAEP
jgi:hypothetical protein